MREGDRKQEIYNWWPKRKQDQLYEHHARPTNEELYMLSLVQAFWISDLAAQLLKNLTKPHEC